MSASNNMNEKTASILIIILLFVAGVVYFTFFGTDPRNEPVACTMEALACPDGTFVGRTGPQCQFDPCPNKEFIVGTLRRNAEGFELILPAPEGIGGQETSYVMPLIVRISSAVSGLVGQKVRVFGVFTEGALLAAETIEALPEGENDSEIGEVRVGRSVFINGVKITLNGIVGDSRCPSDVKCIWAGNVTANVTLQSNTDTETREIVSDASPVPFDSYQISIKEVRPAKVSEAETPAGDYMIVFNVVSN